MNQRREVTFADWDAVLDDLHQLQEAGYDRVGNWDLGQTCQHLNDWLRYPLEGFPVQPLPIRGLMWLLKISMGLRMRKKILATGKMPAGGPTLGETVYKSDSTVEASAVQQLEETIARFRRHTGTLHASPLFGAMDKETTQRLQLVHFAHHLSFLRSR